MFKLLNKKLNFYINNMDISMDILKSIPKWDYFFDVQPIIAIGYSNEEWYNGFNTQVINRFYFLCFILTIYYSK